jgi:hypothetical protein
MLVCPYCGHQNREGTLFCEECGQTLFGDNASAATATKQLQNVPDELGMKATWGTARFNSDASIIVHIRDGAEPVVLQPRQETVLGRLDPNSDAVNQILISRHMVHLIKAFPAFMLRYVVVKTR